MFCYKISNNAIKELIFFKYGKWVIFQKSKYFLLICYIMHFTNYFRQQNIFKNTSFSYRPTHSSFMTLRTGGYKFIRIEQPLYPLPLEDRRWIQFGSNFGDGHFMLNFFSPFFKFRNNNKNCEFALKPVSGMKLAMPYYNAIKQE